MILSTELQTTRETMPRPKHEEIQETKRETKQEIIRPERTTAAEGAEYLMQEIRSLPKQVLAQIETLPINELKRYSASWLYDALKRATTEYESIKRKKQWLEAAIALKYEDTTQAIRLRRDKTTGVLHIIDQGYKITNDIPKKVEWDQKILGDIWDKLWCNGIEGGDDNSKDRNNILRDCIETRYHISEANYNNLSATDRAIFDPARVIKLGKSNYKITKIDASKAGEVSDNCKVNDNYNGNNNLNNPIAKKIIPQASPRATWISNELDKKLRDQVGNHDRQGYSQIMELPL